METQREPGCQQTGFRGRLDALEKRYGIFKPAKFAIATGTGFLIAEAIIALDLFELYGRFTAPTNAYSSPEFVAVDVAALALGVAASFFLNERFTVNIYQTSIEGVSNSFPARLLKFEGVNAMGNLTILVVQFILLWTLSVTPVIGNIVGAIVSFPVTYLISMHFVWRGGPRRTVVSHPGTRREAASSPGPRVTAA